MLAAAGREFVGHAREREVVGGDEADARRGRAARGPGLRRRRARSCELVPPSSSSSRNSAGAGQFRATCFRRRISAMKREWPSSQRIHGADGSAQRQLRDARGASRRTGAPASASTALTPTARSSVLLPDMLEPLTMQQPQRRRNAHAVAHAARLRRGEDGPDVFGLQTPARFRRTPEMGRPDAPRSNWRGTTALRFRSTTSSQPWMSEPFPARQFFDRHGDLRGPQQRRIEDADDEVVAGIEQFHPAPQTRDAPGGGAVPFTSIARAQSGQARRFETAALRASPESARAVRGHAPARQFR